MDLYAEFQGNPLIGYTLFLGCLGLLIVIGGKLEKMSPKFKAWWKELGL
jgi:hypothetical protein